MAAGTVKTGTTAIRPVLARPWLHIQSATDTTHVPSWLSLEQQQFSKKLYSSGINGYPVLVASTIQKMKAPNPQIAFAGRSNVGKSTLLNQLLHGHPDPMQQRGRAPISERRKLDSPTAAAVSHKPGRTRHLFRFEIGGKMTLVDLPGYGYARASREVRGSWASLIDEYFEHALRLERVISLVDASVGVKDSDEQLWEMLQSRKKSLMVVVTKVDKVSPHELNRTMANVISLLQRLDGEYLWPYVHAVSGLAGHGMTELRASLSTVASDFEKRRVKRRSRLN